MVSTLKFSQFNNSGDLKNADQTVGFGGNNNLFFNNPWTFLPPGNTASRPSPAASVAFQLRLNTDSNLYEYYNTATLSWVQLSTDQDFNWNVVTANTPMIANNGYLVNSAGNVTLTLPLVSNIGSTISIAGFNMGIWIIAQNAGQSIIASPLVTTAGVGGSLAAANGGDSVNLVCCVANTQWIVLGGPQSTGLTII